MHTEDVVFALQDRLTAYLSTKDPQLLLVPEALAEADRLYYAVDWYAPREDWVDAARAFTIAVVVARLHWERWQLLGEQEGSQDLSRAMLFQMVYPLAPQHVPERLCAVYRAQGHQPQAITGHIEKANGLAVDLLRQAERTGEGSYLNEATALLLYATLLDPADEIRRGITLIHLGNVLTRKFEYTGDAGALTRAIDCHEQAMKAIRAGDVHHLMGISGLGHALIRQFELTGDPDVLSRAINEQRAAVRAAPDDAPH